MKCNGWCGLCYENRRGRGNHSGHWGYCPSRGLPLIGRSAVKRPATQPGVGTPTFGPGQVPPWELECVLLREYMSDGKWEDGSERLTSTLLLLWEDGVYKGCLHDRAMERSLWAAGPSMTHVMEALESMLAEGTGQWRRSGKPRRKS